MRLIFMGVLALFTVNTSLAGKAMWTLPYSVKKDSVTKHLGLKLAKMIIHITNYDAYNAGIVKEIQVKDQKNAWQTYTCTSKNEIEMLVAPGNQTFEFFINAKFYSVEMTEHEILPSHTQWITMSFSEKSTSDGNNNTPDARTYVFKPVIYTYGNNIPCSIQIKPVGNFTFTYPNYTSGWSGIAHKDGSFTVNEIRYPYLFWESAQDYVFEPSTNGFRVTKDEVTSFLEQKLNELGFTDKEKTDFITFWGPKLVQHEIVFIQFEFGEVCDRYAKLTCSPEPEWIQRVYISFCKWDDSMSPYLKDEQFVPMSRDGFGLLEWGGHVIPFDVTF